MSGPPWASAAALGTGGVPREQAALAQAMAAREAVLDRLAWQLTELRASLDKMAVANAAIGRLAQQYAPSAYCQMVANWFV